MLTEIVSEIFKMVGQTWTLSNDKVIEPDDNDVERFFDEAAKHLHGEEVGARLSVPGSALIIEKRPNNLHGVYVYVGDYK